MDKKQYRKEIVESRTEQDNVLKKHIEDLQSEHSFSLPPSITLDEELKRGTLFAAKVTLKDGLVLDPCLLFVKPAEDDFLSQQNISSYLFFDTALIHVGGEVSEIAASDYTIPQTLYNLAEEKTFEYRMDTWMPLMVSINNEAKYIIRPFKAFFFEPTTRYKGKDLDPTFCELPDENEQKKGHYLWSDNLDTKTALILVQQ